MKLMLRGKIPAGYRRVRMGELLNTNHEYKIDRGGDYGGIQYFNPRDNFVRICHDNYPVYIKK